MTEPSTPPYDDERVEGRATLLPEERAVGSDAPLEQAEVLLEESDLRTDDPDEAVQQPIEHRTSEQAADLV